jgi:hypothetical protein
MSSRSTVKHLSLLDCPTDVVPNDQPTSGSGGALNGSHFQACHLTTETNCYKYIVETDVDTKLCGQRITDGVIATVKHRSIRRSLGKACIIKRCRRQTIRVLKAAAIDAAQKNDSSTSDVTTTDELLCGRLSIVVHAL